MRKPWRVDVPCRNRTELMYGAEVEKAKALCAECPVRELCLWDTLAAEPQRFRYGVAGGTSSEDRERLHISQHAARERFDLVLAAWERGELAPEPDDLLDAEELVLSAFGISAVELRSADKAAAAEARRVLSLILHQRSYSYAAIGLFLRCHGVTVRTWVLQAGTGTGSKAIADKIRASLAGVPGMSRTAERLRAEAAAASAEASDAGPRRGGQGRRERAAPASGTG